MYGHLSLQNNAGRTSIIGYIVRKVCQQDKMLKKYRLQKIEETKTLQNKTKWKEKKTSDE